MYSDTGHLTLTIVQRLSMLLFRYWHFDIQLNLYGECLPFVHRYWTLDIHLGLYCTANVDIHCAILCECPMVNIKTNFTVILLDWFISLNLVPTSQITRMLQSKVLPKEIPR